MWYNSFKLYIMRYCINFEEVAKMPINCEFDHCKYNKNFKCVLDEISVNAFGMCEDCILVSFERDFLEKKKKNSGRGKPRLRFATTM